MSYIDSTMLETHDINKKTKRSLDLKLHPEYLSCITNGNLFYFWKAYSLDEIKNFTLNC